MALQVWLPLTEDTRNQGLCEVTVTNNGTTVNDTGKIGKCYATTADGNGIILTDYMNTLKNYSNYSMCAWIYMSSSATSHSSTIMSSGNWNTSNGNLCFALYSYSSGYARLLIPNKGGWQTYINLTNHLMLETWYHVAITYDGTKTRAYVNGSYIGESSSGGICENSNSTNLKIGAATYTNGFTLKGKLNDIRIYDHALSAKEIKEISKGLIIHYKLENHKIKNIMSYPTFETSSASGGWSHWGSTGHKGSYSQNTDPEYIYGNQPYSHKVSNGISATVATYLTYQSPAFDADIASGGYRSMVMIVKSEDGAPIDESICRPAANDTVAASSVTTAGKWTSINSLGNGFYECEFEGIYQKGTNNLIGFHVFSGKTIYVSSCYIENYSTRAGNTFGEDTDVMEDSSGYNRHGVHISGTVVAMKTTEGRYESCLQNLNGYMGKATVNIPSLDQITIAWWGNYTAFGSQTSGLFATSDLDTYPTDYTTTAGNMRDTRIDICNVAGTYKGLTTSGLELNKWQHYCMTYNGTTAIWYVNGTQLNTVAQTGALKSFKYIYLGFSKAGGVTRMCTGKMADFRVYCTALSADDVMELYHTPASIDNKGNLHCYEMKEV